MVGWQLLESALDPSRLRGDTADVSATVPDAHAVKISERRGSEHRGYRGELAASRRQGTTPPRTVHGLFFQVAEFVEYFFPLDDFLLSFPFVLQKSLDLGQFIASRVQHAYDYCRVA